MNLDSNQMQLIELELNERFLRLYFLQLANDEFVFSENVKKTTEQMYGELNAALLERLSYKELKKILGSYFIKKVYLFGTDLIIHCLNTFSLEAIIEERKIILPRIFTGILQTSEDAGGLFVLESYNSQLLELYSKNGQLLIETCSDIELGSAGEVYYRLNNSIFWEKGKVSLGVDSEIVDKNYDNKAFPYIEDRDERKSILQKKDFPNKEMLNENNFAEFIRNNPDKLRYFQPLFEQNKDFALLAVLKNPLLFSLLCPFIQQNKSFVISVLKASNEPEKIYRFLSNYLKADYEILEIMNFPSEDQNINKSMDDLPF